MLFLVLVHMLAIILAHLSAVIGVIKVTEQQGLVSNSLELVSNSTRL